MYNSVTVQIKRPLCLNKAKKGKEKFTYLYFFCQ